MSKLNDLLKSLAHDFASAALDYYPSEQAFWDQLLKTEEIRRALRERGFIVVRTRTTANQLMQDIVTGYLQ